MQRAASMTAVVVLAVRLASYSSPGASTFVERRNLRNAPPFVVFIIRTAAGAAAFQCGDPVRCFMHTADCRLSSLFPFSYSKKKFAFFCLFVF